MIQTTTADAPREREMRAEPPSPPTTHRIPKPVRALVAILVLTLVGVAVWYFFLRPAPAPTNVIAVSGRIESDDSAVAPKVAGRVREVTVREGDRVTAGQVIAVLDDDQIRAREEQAQFAVDQAVARVERARRQIAVLERQREQSRLGIDQARLDAAGRVDQARANLATAEAQLAQAEATYRQAAYDAEKFGRLAREGIEPERTARQTKAVADAQEAAVVAARKQVEAAEGALETARSSLANAAIRREQTSAVDEQIDQASADVAAAEADAARARAGLDEARANRNDLVITAPFDATVATRAVEPGEVVAAGTPIVTLVDLSKVYLRAFIPEGQIGRVAVGQRARVYLDSAPGEPIEAVVSRVDPEASFTPENTYFRDDRVKQVVGVKLQLEGAVGFAKPGMPADGEIFVEISTASASERVRGGPSSSDPLAGARGADTEPA
jgi:HlyD family secretion protein